MKATALYVFILCLLPKFSLAEKFTNEEIIEDLLFYESGGVGLLNYPEELAKLTTYLEFYKNVRSLAGQGACYGAIGGLESSHANHDDGTLNLFKAAKIFNELGWYKRETVMYYVIALNTFIAFKNTEARKLFKKIVPSFIDFKMQQFVGLSYLGIARTYNNEMVFDSALVYLDKSMKVEQNLDNCNSLRSEIQLEKGHAYLYQENYVKSTEYYQLSYLSALDVSYLEMELLASTCLGQSHSLNGDFELADSVLTYSEKLALENDNIYYLEQIYFEKMSHFERVGNDKMFEKYTLLYNETHDSILSLSNESMYSNSLSEIEILTLEKENLIKKNEIKELGLIQSNERSKQIIWIVVLLSVICISFLVTLFVIRNLRNKGKLIRQNKKLAEYEKMLLKKEIEQKELRADLLSNEIEMKEGKLTDFAMELTTSNEFSKKLLIKLYDLVESDSAEVEIRELILFLKNHLKNGDIQRSEFNVDDINEAFFQRLGKKYNKITKAEKGILGMIRLGMSSKDIAEIKNIQVNSVEIYRHRLRKKLELKRDENLVSFLRNV